MPPGMPSGPMLTGGNPYGPSGPPPLGLSSQLSHGHSGGAMYPSGPPMPRPSHPISTVQLQQLSAQIRSYRLLARSLAPPETLLSIAHGRKPTAAMMARAQAHMHQYSRAMMGQLPVHTSQAPPYPQGHAQELPSSSSPLTNQPPPSSVESQNTGSIQLYPPSPGVSGSQSPDIPQARATASPVRPQTSSSMTAAPNVTLPPGGELPLAVKQVAAAAAAAASERQSPTPTQPPATSSAPQTSTSSQQTPQDKQAKAVHSALKQMKLSPIGKPPGIDPTAVLQERERRYMYM